MMIQCTTDGIGTNKFDLLYSLSMNAVILVFSQMTRISMIYQFKSHRFILKNSEKSLVCGVWAAVRL